jgi:hypothetical protein
MLRALSAGFAILALLVVGVAKAEPTTHWAIPAGIEERVGQMLGVSEPPTASCRFTGAEIENDRIVTRFDCGSSPVTLDLLHPEAAGAAGASPQHVTRQFVIVPRGTAPSDLLDALTERIRAGEGDWAWIAVNAPRTRGRDEPLLRAYEWLLGHEGGGEQVLALFLLAALVAMVVREGRDGRLTTAAALFAGSLILRWLVPWVPANFYDDLATPFPSYRFDEGYQNPFYDCLWWFTRNPRAPFIANVILGSLVPPLLYLALRADGPLRNGDRDKATWMALPFAATVAALPLYVRLSASEAPAISALFCFAAGAFLFRRAITVGGWLPHLGFAVAAWMVGAIRRELALGPIIYAFFAVHLNGRKAFAGAKARSLALLLAAIFLGVTFTHLALAGHPNAIVELELPQILVWLRGVPRALLMREWMVPTLLQLGLLVFALDALVRWKPQRLLAYPAGLLLLTFPYALNSAFAGAVGEPLVNWAFSRYALIWYLWPTAFAVWGLERGWDGLRHLPGWVAVPLAVGVTVGLWWNVLPAYRILHPYQAEFLFLGRSLPIDGDAPPLLVGWQKNAGYDFCESLAMPYFALATPSAPRDVRVVDASKDLDDIVRELPPKSIYFLNALPQIRLPLVSSSADELIEEEALAKFRALACFAQRNGKLIRSDEEEIVYQQTPVGIDGKMRLALYLLERPPSGWDRTGCDGSTE